MPDDFENLYGSKYLAASDVTKPFTTVIEDVETLDFAREGERKRPKAVLTLKGVKKPIVVNKTNALNLSEAFGKKFSDWISNRITVKPERTQFGGKPVMGLRLYPANSEKPALAKKRDDSENPADFDDAADLDDPVDDF
jgi:hypothetical protein